MAERIVVVSNVPLPDLPVGKPSVVVRDRRIDGLLASGKVDVVDDGYGRWFPQTDDDTAGPRDGGTVTVDVATFATVEEQADDVPQGTIKTVLAWVDDATDDTVRLARATAALEAEMYGEGRTTLVETLDAVVESLTADD